VKIKVLFSYPCTPFGKLVEDVEGKGEPSHTGIILYGQIFEALENGFVKSPLNSYDAFKHKIVEVNVPNLSHAQLEAKRLLYTPYGYFDCIVGGARRILNRILKHLFKRAINIEFRGNGERTVNCSEAVTRILRAGGLDVLPEVYADDVTPADLLEALLPIAVNVEDFIQEKK